jgi:hypothetical protein
VTEAEKKKLSRYRPPRTERMDRRDHIAKMNRELLLTENFKPVNSKIKLPSRSETILQIDIAMIGAVEFRRHTRKKDTEIFMTHLYEIDRIIEEKTENISDPEAELITHLGRNCLPVIRIIETFSQRVLLIHFHHRDPVIIRLN